jgi:glycosyltransferase involved in cell wall biosynthesis
VLDFRQIGDRLLPINTKIRLRNQIRSLTRGSAAKYCFDQSVYLHYLGAEKGLGRDWKRWGTVVPMGVDDLFLNVTPSRNGQADKENKVRFIYIGSMVQHRKLDTLFKAIKAVCEKRDDFVVHFLGRDKSEGYYPNLIKQLEIQDFVTLLPLIPYSEVPQRLTEYDAALGYVPYEPTDWTHHPTLKILEYRAVGIPIIASDVAPNFDSVENNRNGILCANTTENFANAMLKFIEDPQYRVRLKENALQMREGMTWEEAAQMYEELYTALLARKRGDTSRSA